MTCTCARQRMRLLGVPLACLLVSVPLNACAEIEVGAEVAKRISRTSQATDLAPVAAEPAAGSAQQVQLAQASTNGNQTQAISPFLKPAPEIFEATGLAVWDGKRTLQGIWVAHPAAKSARRVRIFNQNNGQAVDGALFKRDTADNGASILISSEAAQLLGMGVGAPAELRIVAVSPVQRATEPEATDQTAAVEQTTKPANAETAETQPETTTAAAEQTTATPTPAAKPKPVEPAKPVASIVPAKPAEQPKPEPVVAKTEPAKPEKPARTAKTSPLKLPYIQAGIFGVADNAQKLIRRIEKQNIPAEGRTLRSKGRKLTRVVAGPFQTTDERQAALRKIRGMGLKDATPVRR